MIITIKNDSGESVYDTDKIKNEALAREAAVIISKTGTLEVMIEALSFTSQTHRNNLEKLLADAPESLVEDTPDESVEAETKEVNS
tara:strand:+ start:1034 stop:1291 length:258 start_codon:yes stop_codon:yes gene_type:complete